MKELDLDLTGVLKVLENYHSFNRNVQEINLDDVRLYTTSEFEWDMNDFINSLSKERNFISKYSNKEPKNYTNGIPKTWDGEDNI